MTLQENLPTLRRRNVPWQLQRGPGSWQPERGIRIRQPGALTGFDTFLMVVFLVGLYLGWNLQITPTIPLANAPSGVAGLILLLRRHHDIKEKHIVGFFVVVMILIASILVAPNWMFLSRRFNGLLQMTYGLVIAYGMFLTMLRANRDQIANILLIFCLFILFGCALEIWGGLRPISDAIRAKLYSAQLVYDADLRDIILYGRPRPKLFTSEPSNVTFAFTLFSAFWLALCTWRTKYLVFAGLFAMAVFVLPGPTLMLMLLLATLYLQFLAGGHKRTDPLRMMAAMIITLMVLAGAYFLTQILFAERLYQLKAGQDASSFLRFTGPMQVAIDVVKNHPLTGAGLTGETYLGERIITSFARSPIFDPKWPMPPVASALTNYFWLHWVYLGAVFGVLVIAGLTYWLGTLGTASFTYCWAVWIVLGQASGGYVTPKPWSVLLMAAAVSVLVARSHPAPIRRPVRSRWAVRVPRLY